RMVGDLLRILSQRTNLKRPYFYVLNEELRCIGLTDTRPFEYSYRNGEWSEITHDTDSLANVASKQHGYKTINQIFDYDFEGERRFVSIGFEGKAYEFAFRNGQWVLLNGLLTKAIRDIKKQLWRPQTKFNTVAEVIRKAHQGLNILHAF